jgi:hypothetical protein
MTTLIALVVLMAPQAAVPKPTTPPSLVVQLVDPHWLPIPGAAVTVKPLSGKGQSSVVHTDEDGYAKFWLTEGQDYTIEAKLPGFKTKRLKNVHLFNYSTGVPETAYIQLQLKPSERPITVY